MLYDLVSENECVASIFKHELRENKHYFLILKVFQDSYYDVQTHCAQIVKVLELDASIRDKIFSFMNYVIYPPEVRESSRQGHDIDFAYHSPIFTNQDRNIIDQTEELKVNMGNISIPAQLKGSKRAIMKVGSADPEITVNRRESKYLADLNDAIGSGASEEASPTLIKFCNRKDSESSIGNSSFTESNIMSPKSILKSGVKTNLQTFEETKDEQESNALDNYLQRLMEDRQYKESPIIETENKLEFTSHRKSGKSTSPNRMGSERQSITRFRESTN